MSKEKFVVTDVSFEVRHPWTNKFICRVYRIRALRDFGNVKKGDVGGYVESEQNLSHDGDCWVTDDAIVRGNARVSGNALVSDRAIVKDDAIVDGDSHVTCLAEVQGDAHITGSSYIGKDRVIKTGVVGSLKFD